MLRDDLHALRERRQMLPIAATKVRKRTACSVLGRPVYLPQKTSALLSGASLAGDHLLQLHPPPICGVLGVLPG
jgi:hypothetical protein